MAETLGGLCLLMIYSTKTIQPHDCVLRMGLKGLCDVTNLALRHQYNRRISNGIELANGALR
jgi:hypothetical protein